MPSEVVGINGFVDGVDDDVSTVSCSDMVVAHEARGSWTPPSAYHVQNGSLGSIVDPERRVGRGDESLRSGQILARGNDYGTPDRFRRWTYT